MPIIFYNKILRYELQGKASTRPDIFRWRGGVVVIRLPHDPEVPSSSPG